MHTLKPKQKIISNPEILFVFPTYEEWCASIFTFPFHLGAAYILAYLKKMGIPAAQLIQKEPVSLYDLTTKILLQQPKIVGFTCYDANYYFVKLISGLLKKRNPEVTIVVGGPTATFSDKLIMWDNPAIDICVRGEGEYTTHELVRQIREKGDLGHILGITFRCGNKIIQNQERALIKEGPPGKELDIFPSPYLANVITGGDNRGILTSRGCVFKCVYCAFPSVSGRNLRYHSVERVISELKMIQSNSAFDTRVSIYDDNFALDIKRAKQICQRIIDEKITLKFFTRTRADQIDRELLYLMRKAGFYEINFGLESAVPEVLKTAKKVRCFCQKPDNLASEKRFIKKLKENVELAKKIGLNPLVSVIIGLPGATAREDRKTIEYIKQLKIKYYEHNYLMFYPGTELFKTRKKYGLGIKTPQTLLPYQTKYSYNVYKVPELKNSLTNFKIGKQTERELMVLTGDYSDSRGGLATDLLFKDCSISKKIKEWLIRFMPISPVMIFLIDNKNRPARKEMITALYFGIPIINFCLLSPIGKKYPEFKNLFFKYAKYRFSLDTEIILARRKASSYSDILDFTPSKTFFGKRQGRPFMHDGGTPKFMFTFHDLDKIINLLGLSEDAGKIVLKGKLAVNDCYFLDECRWSHKECPAVKFRRAVIDSNGLILPCLNGRPIGRIGEDKDAIIKNINSLWNTAKIQRGCARCIAKDRCSKCLFPYPMDSQEYCRLRRKNADRIDRIIKISTLFKITRSVRYSQEMLYKPKIRKIVGILDGDFMTIKINNEKTSYIYSHSYGLYARNQGSRKDYSPSFLE